MTEIKRKKAKRKVTFEDIETAVSRGNANLEYFVKYGKLPFNR